MPREEGGMLEADIRLVAVVPWRSPLSDNLFIYHINNVPCYFGKYSTNPDP
jgi:hypothetical protein